MITQYFLLRDGPMKDLLSISYLLLTLLGATLTIVIGFPVSILTGGMYMHLNLTSNKLT